MRWARGDDVKKKGAKKTSDFYKKYGSTAGKEIGGQGPPKRRREGGEGDKWNTMQELDDDLDAFLAGQDDDEEPEARPSPPSKMYSDYISNDGKTLLERTSLIRAHPTDLASRLTVPLPRRARETGRERKRDESAFDARPSSRSNRAKSGETPLDKKGRGRRGERPKKSQQDLDDELEAFLNERD
jgi:hypothetical protein